MSKEWEYAIYTSIAVMFVGVLAHLLGFATPTFVETIMLWFIIATKVRVSR